jgi:hypothetical protein
MRDNPTSIDELLEDVEIDANSREIAKGLYNAALMEGHGQDAALDMAANALRRMRREWEDAKEADSRR